MKQRTLTLDDLTPLQQRLLERIMQGRQPMYQGDLDETINDIARLNDEQVRQELRWYGLTRPATTNGSSASDAMAQAID